MFRAASVKAFVGNRCPAACHKLKQIHKKRCPSPARSLPTTVLPGAPLGPGNTHPNCAEVCDESKKEKEAVFETRSQTGFGCGALG